MAWKVAGEGPEPRASGILGAIGNTPMAKIDGVLVKLEHLNPSGSVKDRIARYIVSKAENSGELRNGYTIVEATSGNTGIAFSFVAALRGYGMIAVMPHGMSRERMQIIKGYGAKVMLAGRGGCVKCAVERAEAIARLPQHYMPRQFENPWNMEEHETVMGPEILRQMSKMNERIDCFVAGVGTGGTLLGCGRAIKKAFPKAALVAVEPAECALLSGSGYGEHRIFGLHKNACAKHRKHMIEGIGDGFIPKIVSSSRHMIDDIITVKSSDAVRETRRLCRMGYFVGPSSGANMLAARMLQKRYKNVVTLFPDRGDRYLSEKIFRK
jgi:cysteine synthase A